VTPHNSINTFDVTFALFCLSSRLRENNVSAQDIADTSDIIQCQHNSTLQQQPMHLPGLQIVLFSVIFDAAANRPMFISEIICHNRLD
jgi:hypothetical protein